MINAARPRASRCVFSTCSRKPPRCSAHTNAAANTSHALPEKNIEAWQARRISGSVSLDKTLQLQPEATITARTLRVPAYEDQGLERTITAQDGRDGSPTESSAHQLRISLPRISLGPLTTDASNGQRQHEPDLTLTRLLGEGGMGRVHLAQQRSLGRDVAVKTLKDKAEASRQALISEARITSYLAHPNIIPVFKLNY